MPCKSSRMFHARGMYLGLHPMIISATILVRDLAIILPQPGELGIWLKRDLLALLSFLADFLA